MADINNFNDALAEYAGSSHSGTLMVVFSDNTLGRFYLQDGALATARYQNRQGREALAAAQQKMVQSVKFHANADLVRSSKMVSGTPPPQPAAGSEPATAGAEPAREDIPEGELLTDDLRSSLEDLLADFIGPVAQIMMSDLPQPVTIDAAIAQLSSEMPDVGQASRFVRAARLALTG